MWHLCQPNVPTNKAILQRATDGNYDNSAPLPADTPVDSSLMPPVGDPSGNECLTPGQLYERNE